MKRKVIDAKNTIFRSPIMSAITIWLLLDRLKAAGWVYGVLGTWYFIWLVAYLVDIFNTEMVDIFDETPAMTKLRNLLKGK